MAVTTGAVPQLGPNSPGAVIQRLFYSATHISDAAWVVGGTGRGGGPANAAVIVIDEVGKMEVESPNFVLAVKDALDADKPLLLTLHKKSRNPLLQDIRRRDDVRILEVTMVNRNLLPYKIVKLMKGEVL